MAAEAGWDVQIDGFRCMVGMYQRGRRGTIASLCALDAPCSAIGFRISDANQQMCKTGQACDNVCSRVSDVEDYAAHSGVVGSASWHIILPTPQPPNEKCRGKRYFPVVKSDC